MLSDDLLPCNSTLIQKASRQLNIEVPSFDAASQVEWSKKVASLLPKWANQNYELSEHGGGEVAYTLNECEVNRSPVEWVGEKDNRFPRESALVGVKTGRLQYINLKNGCVLQMANLGHLVIAGDKVIAPLSTPYAPLIPVVDLDIQKCIKNAVHVSGHALLIADRFWEPNYAHWLLDVLARFSIFIEDNGLDFRIIVSPIQRSWQRQMLAAVGVKSEDIVELNGNTAITAETLIVPSDTGGAVQHPCLRAHPTALERIRKSVNIPELKHLKDTVVIVSREKRGTRLLTNEMELVERLERYGSVLVVDLENFSIEEQWGIFHWSRGICAVHGAGLANTIMLKSESFVVEVLPPSYANPAFWMISQGVGARYIGVTDVVENCFDRRPILRDVRLSKRSIESITETLFLGKNKPF